MALKDSMRETCLKDLTDACIQLVANLQGANPELATSVLEAVARYVNWIDIGLVANDRLDSDASTHNRARGQIQMPLLTTVLEAVARYVNWIDIGLVANDRLGSAALLQSLSKAMKCSIR